MMMEKLLIEEQIIKRWHQKTITRPSPIDLHPTVRINERFGTAIAIWVFSIRSYSLTKRFIAASRL